MRRWLSLAVVLACFSANAQTRLPIEANSQITVLVDLSGTWLNNESRTKNEKALESVASAIATLLPAIKPPVDIRYLEIGDGSLSKAPLCSARFSPSIFPSLRPDELATVQAVSQFFGDDCTRLILSRKSADFTDISGALNTVSRISINQNAQFKAIIALSDFQEERRPGQSGGIGSLKGTRTLLIYRVLDHDRLNPADLERRLETWQKRLEDAGASVVMPVIDVNIDPAAVARLLTR